MSLTIADVIATLQQLKVSPQILIAAETQLEALVAEQKADAEAAPKQKNQMNVLLLDPENKLAGLPAFTAIVTSIPAADDVGLTLGRIHAAAYAQNAAPGKKKWAIKDVSEIGSIKRKFLTEQHVACKSGKQPVQVIVTTGVIPQA